MYQAREKYKTVLDTKLSNYRNEVCDCALHVLYFIHVYCIHVHEVCVSVYLVLSGVDEISSTPGTIHAYLKL